MDTPRNGTRSAGVAGAARGRVNSTVWMGLLGLFLFGLGVGITLHGAPLQPADGGPIQANQSTPQPTEETVRQAGDRMANPDTDQSKQTTTTTTSTDAITETVTDTSESDDDRDEKGEDENDKDEEGEDEKDKDEKDKDEKDKDEKGDE